MPTTNRVEIEFLATDKVSSIIAQIEHNTRKASSTIQKENDSMYQSFDKLKNLLQTAFVATFYAKAVKYAFNAAAAFEAASIGFKTLLGSEEKAKSFLKTLSDFAAKTPFSVTGVRGLASQLIAVGFEAEQVIPVLTNVGNVVAGLGFGEDVLQRVIRNLGQVQAQGKLTGRELNDFLTNSIPLIDGLAESMGVAKSEVRDLAAQGKISSDDVMKAFESMGTGSGKFADFMAKNMGTVNAAISNLKDEIITAAESFGSVLIPAIKAVTKEVTELVGKFNELPEETRKIIAVGGVSAGAVGVGAYAAFKLRGQTPVTPMYVKEVGIGKGGIGGIGNMLGMVASFAPFALAFATAIALSVGGALALQKNEKKKLEEQGIIGDEAQIEYKLQKDKEAIKTRNDDLLKMDMLQMDMGRRELEIKLEEIKKTRVLEETANKATEALQNVSDKLAETINVAETALGLAGTTFTSRGSFASSPSEIAAIQRARRDAGMPAFKTVGGQSIDSEIFKQIADNTNQVVSNTSGNQAANTITG